MNLRPVTELSLYRYRYGIGYLVLVVLTVGLLLLNLGSLPAGFSQAEEASAVASSQIPFSKDVLQTVNTVELPYHLLQRLSLELFGLSPLGVRLPSILLATVSILFVFLMLRRWLFDNVALITGVLMATSSWFLYLGRSGTPDIMMVFWTSVILLLATYISQQTKHHLAWKTLILLCVGLALYTPLTIYLFISALIAAVAQPHLRYIVRYIDGVAVALGLLMLAIVLVPLGAHVWREPEVIKTFLAIPADFPSPVTFVKDFAGVVNNLINPFKTELAPVVLPMLSIPLAAFVLLGLARLVIDYHSARSYTLLVWFAVLVPIIGLNPQATAILFIPLAVVCGIGVHALFSYWYRLFPRNPYARVFGLVPIALLLATTVSFNYQRYFIASPYAANAAQLYDADPVLLNRAITAKAYRDTPLVVVVPRDKLELYRINQMTNPRLTVTDAAGFAPDATTSRVIVAQAEAPNLSLNQLGFLPAGTSTLLVTDRAQDALRFRVYGGQ